MTTDAARLPERFTFPAEFVVEDSGAGPGHFTIRGHAAVFNQPSHLILGAFRTVVKDGAFAKVLEKAPDVHMTWDHDTRYTLGRTTSKTLELRVDPIGLHSWCRVAPTSYAADLRVLMERGDLNQMSWSGYIGADEWHEDTDGNVTRYIVEVDELLDVCVCAQGAFPQTDVSIAATRDAYNLALQSGRVLGRADAGSARGDDAGADDDVAPTGVDLNSRYEREIAHVQASLARARMHP